MGTGDEGKNKIKNSSSDACCQIGSRSAMLCGRYLGWDEWLLRRLDHAANEVERHDMLCRDGYPDAGLNQG